MGGGVYQSCGWDVEDKHRKGLGTRATLSWLCVCTRGRRNVRRAIITEVETGGRGGESFGGGMKSYVPSQASQLRDQIVA